MNAAVKFGLVLFASLLLLPLRAEDWALPNGTTYHDVKVLSHDAAYVTIMHRDGGGRVLLGTLPPDLQKRFDYDAAKAADAIAARAVADERNREALAAEKQRAAADQARRDQEVSDAIALAIFSGPPPTTAADTNTADAVPPPSNPPPLEPDAAAIVSEPPTQIDDWSYGDAGAYYGYGGYGYYGSGYGYRGYRGGWSHVNGTTSHVHAAGGSFHGAATGQSAHH